MYNLKVKINGIWHDLDLGDDKPAMNYEQNDINEFKNRNSNWSHKLELPVTGTNIRALSFLNKIEVDTTAPQKLYECRLYKNEYEVVGKDGRLQIISASRDGIIVQILSGIIDLFELLNKNKMKDVDLGVFRSVASEFVPSRFTDFKIIASTYSQGFYPGQNFSKIGNVLPFSRFIKVVDKVLAQYGYTLETEIRNEVKDVVLASVLPPKAPDNFDDYFVLKAENKTKIWRQSDDVFSWQIKQDLLNEIIFYPPNQDPIRRRLVWIAENNERINVKWYSDFSFLIPSGGLPGFYPGQIKMNIYRNGTLIASRVGENLIDYSADFDVNAGDTFWFNFSFDFNMNDVLLNTPNYPDYTPKLDTQLTITLKKDSELPFKYLPINIAESLGFDTQLDLIKAFMLTYGLAVSIDPINKVLKANNFKTIVGRKNIALDWTNKVDMSDWECEYHLNKYAQSNTISMLENSKDNYSADTTIFSIADETLDQEKEFINLPFETGINKGNQTSIPIIINENGAGGVLKIKEVVGTKPHLCRLHDSIRYDFGTGAYNYQKTSHIRMNELRQYYTHLFSVFNQYRKLTLKMLLSPNDIKASQDNTPIYLRQYNRYFYVMSIKKYIVGELAEVELLLI